ncbi:MAG: ribosome-binding factor A [Gammaproteobacteria bacterium]|nr:MAG: ribosome-binding factor A [Gammaproteobacteria bacterium]
MAQQYGRQQKIADQMQRELAALIQMELRDPRLGMVTISGVRVSSDLSHADVYVTVLGDNADEEIKQTLDILKRASGFLKKSLGKNMNLRQIPQLRFHYDSSARNGERMSQLIDHALEEDKKFSSKDESS